MKCPHCNEKLKLNSDLPNEIYFCCPSSYLKYRINRIFLVIFLLTCFVITNAIGDMLLDFWLIPEYYFGIKKIAYFVFLISISSIGFFIFGHFFNGHILIKVIDN